MGKLVLVKNGKSGHSKSSILFHGISGVVPFSFCNINKPFTCNVITYFYFIFFLIQEKFNSLSKKSQKILRQFFSDKSLFIVQFFELMQKIAEIFLLTTLKKNSLMELVINNLAKISTK